MEADLDNLKATELRLGLPGTEDKDNTSQKPLPQRGSKRALGEADEENKSNRGSCTIDEQDNTSSPQPKTQVVGWPPVRSYRRNCFQAAKKAEESPETSAASGGLYLKVSMDGAPYLRKIDLKVYKGYKELREALEGMFKCFSMEYAITYEDKDGDWMLAGDVPWEMFTSSCKRLRVMRNSEVRGLGSR